MEMEAVFFGLEAVGRREQTLILWTRLVDEKLRREEAEFDLDQLQSNYDSLLNRYAEAENTIDTLRFYRDLPLLPGGTTSLPTHPPVSPAPAKKRTPVTLPPGNKISHQSGLSPNLRSSVGKGGSKLRPGPTAPKHLKSTSEKKRQLTLTPKLQSNPVHKPKTVGKVARTGTSAAANSFSSNTTSTNRMYTNTTKASQESAYMRMECLEDELKVVTTACRNSGLEADEKSGLLAQFRTNLDRLRRDCQKFALSDDQLSRRLRKLRASMEELDRQSTSSTASRRRKHTAPTVNDNSQPSLTTTESKVTPPSDSIGTSETRVKESASHQLSSLPDSAVAELDAALLHVRLEGGPLQLIRRLSEENSDRRNANELASSTGTFRSFQSQRLNCDRVLPVQNRSSPQPAILLSDSQLVAEAPLPQPMDPKQDHSIPTGNRSFLMSQFDRRRTTSTKKDPEPNRGSRSSKTTSRSEVSSDNWILRPRQAEDDGESRRNSASVVDHKLRDLPAKETTAQPIVGSDSIKSGETEIEVADSLLAECPIAPLKVLSTTVLKGSLPTDKFVKKTCVFVDNDTSCTFYTSLPREKQTETNNNVSKRSTKKHAHVPASNLSSQKPLIEEPHFSSRNIGISQNLKSKLFHALDEADQRSSSMKKRSEQMMTLVRLLEHQNS